ncbi:sigma-54 dependent transcriptional regulator [Cryomorphaceae bacterium 1068]|nr:sigma-54 dependent transcriptional regulator [Cryomorphaceae bacterium 1068]
MDTNHHILVIDDEVDICLLLKRFLERKGFIVTTVHKGSDGLKAVSKTAFDLVISDFRLPDYNGLDLLKEMKALRPAVPFIIITGYSDIRMAVEVIKYGAFDYVTKPLYPEELLNMVNEALNQSEPAIKSSPTKQKASSTKSSGNNFKYHKGESAGSQSLYKNMTIVAPTPMSVLIHGETGTGKEFVAKEIHRLSERSDKPFVALDCGALPKDIAGSEFFGHEKGAFTGAVSSREGKFKLADGGTLFLDEIGNLSYEIQLKLLRVLQERKFTKVGGSKDTEVDVRILAATNENLRQAVNEGNFREDLYYRLNEFSLTLNPLRNRKDDIEVFTNLFIDQANEQLHRKVSGITDDVMDKFKSYSWPGNLRELKNVVKRAVLLTEGDTIELDSLPEEIKYGISHTDGPVDDSLKSVANHAERDRILSVLAQTGNNKSKAAKILNIDRKTLYNKLKLFDINPS